MNRCDVRAGALALALIASTIAVSLPTAASAQEVVQRNFPRNALRGEVVVLSESEALLNGKPVRLAPGLRLRGPNNLLLVSGAAQGQKFLAHYTVDTYGLINNLWVLREDEAQRLWPKTEQEAAAWGFDPVAQLWFKP
ncbi:hypothetical protein [Caldimonas sp. KR1-144]|uniref:hypothetical protein n=1 Tax=Caldimonas sp. KR1-144 TaxID=3400911 RepID=UPI003C0914B4